MAVLNSWQKIDRVLPGLPWGIGSAGSSTVSSDPNTRATILGTATQLTSTLGSAILSNGDVCMLHQTQGTGAGQWEIQKVATGGGTTSIIWTKPLQYTYSTGAQCIKIPQYTNATVSAHTVTAWNGTTGGIEIICAKTSITVSGALNGVGANGVGAGMGGTVSPPNGGGFRGGTSQDNVNSFGIQGESPTGAGGASSAANGGGGGGGGGNANFNAGGGGGNGANGTAGTLSDSSNGAAGAANGSADLITLNLGSGGGGATGIANSTKVSGANGGAVVVLISKTVTLSSAITVSGGGHTNAGRITGGGGSGGSVLVVCKDVSLGTNNIVTLGGVTTDNETQQAGDGGVGRIAVHHSGTVTGTSNPTFTDVSDTSLLEKGGALFYSSI